MSGGTCSYCGDGFGDLRPCPMHTGPCVDLSGPKKGAKPMSDAIERWFVSGGWLYHEQPQLGRTGPNASAVLSLHDLTEEEQESLDRALEALAKPADVVNTADVSAWSSITEDAFMSGFQAGVEDERKRTAPCEPHCRLTAEHTHVADDITELVKRVRERLEVYETFPSERDDLVALCDAIERLQTERDRLRSDMDELVGVINAQSERRVMEALSQRRALAGD